MKQLLSHKIINWYENNKRDLPWRHTSKPYRVWLSEIMLQQTQVVQSLPYYERFTNQYPNVEALAKADEQEVLKLWEGLGYYSRARNLHHTAKVIANEMNGQFPKTYKELIKLKGVGDYTASAIASICFNEKQPTVDGNVYRVLSRLFGIETPINTHAAKTEFKTLAHDLMLDKNPGIFNQAMMEFGALQCTPKNPKCTVCPVAERCYAYEHKCMDRLPVKIKKIKVKKRYFDYLIFRLSDGKTILQKRQNQDIWKHLYEFPLIENSSFSDTENLVLKANTWAQVTQIRLLTPNPLKHKLTHQDIALRFWEVKANQTIDDAVSWQDLGDYPLPTAIHRFLETYSLDD